MEIRRCMKCMSAIPAGQDVCPVCGRSMYATASESFALKPGTILEGKYLVGEMLGQGGFGITYIGFDLLLEQKVAIKEYFPMSTGMVSRENRSTVLWSSAMLAKTGAEKGFDSFLKEARKMAKLGGIPGVVGVKSVFIQNETAYIVMDFIQGQTLQKKLEKEGPMDYDTCIQLLTPVLEALAQVHKHGIIHRDISPDNIMVQPDGSLVLLDLGAAKDLEIQKSDGTLQSSQLVAKHGFSPLEQYTRSGHIGTWTDVYAMAATIYYCCTGKLPPAAVERVNNDKLICRPSLTKEQFAVIAKAMALNEKNRPQDMLTLLQSLKKAKTPTPKPDPVKRKRPKWLLPGIAAIAAILVLLGLSSGKTSKKTTPTVPQQTSARVQKNQPTTQPTEPVKTFTMARVGWGSLLVGDGTTNFWNQYEHTRSEVEKVVFQNTLSGAGQDAWDMSEAGDGSVLAWMEGSTLYVGANGNIAPNSEADWLFDSFVNLREIDFGDCFDTSSVTSMKGMFDSCKSLETLDISGFVTYQVTDMGSMFAYCNNLTNLDVSRFDTSNVTDMSYMFCGCNSLTSLDISGFDTSKVTDTSYMFYECSGLTSLDVSGVDTSSVTSMVSMFCGCSSLTSLDASGFDTSQATDMCCMFCGCYSLTNLNISGFDTSNVTDMSWMFCECIGLTSLDVSGFDTSNVTDMNTMFCGCGSLTSLDVSGFDTSNVTNMSGMFYDCSSLTSLDVSGFDTSNVTDMSGMFRYCDSLTDFKCKDAQLQAAYDAR